MSSESICERPGVSLWFTAPRQVGLRASSAAAPGEREVRIQALFSGISHGSEMVAYRGEAPSDLSLDAALPTLAGGFGFPFKYGYASVGRVVDVGRGVRSLSEGDLVFAFNPHETCYTVPASVVAGLPLDLDPLLGIFLANVETAINALLDAAPRLGETVVVTGQGVVGLLLTQLARKAGAGLILTSDIYGNRRSLSRAVGADEVIDPSTQSLSDSVHRMTRGIGADVVIEASGQPGALNDAIRAAASEARVVVVSWYGTRKAALALGSDFHRKRLTLKSSQVSTLDPSLAPRWTIDRRRSLAVSYLGELLLGDLISHVIPFALSGDAYSLIDEKPGEVVQVVLDYSQHTV